MAPDRREIPVLSIIGPVGIGKSTTADHVSKLLGEHGHSCPHAIADLDDFRRSYPAPKPDPFNMELGFLNLAAVWANYEEAGARCLIIPSVMDVAGLERIREAVPGAVVFVVRLTAAIETNHDRIRGRETDVDSLNWHLNRSVELDRILSESRIEHVLITTDGKTREAIAEEALDAWAAHSPLMAQWTGRLDSAPGPASSLE